MVDFGSIAIEDEGEGLISSPLHGLGVEEMKDWNIKSAMTRNRVMQ